MLGEDGEYTYTYDATPGKPNTYLAVDVSSMRIVFSEVATHGLPTEPCGGSGWIELRNEGKAPVEMSHLVLRGDSGEPISLSGKLGAGEFMLVCAEAQFPRKIDKSEALELELRCLGEGGGPRGVPALTSAPRRTLCDWPAAELLLVVGHGRSMQGLLRPRLLRLARSRRSGRDRRDVRVD